MSEQPSRTQLALIVQLAFMAGLLVGLLLPKNNVNPTTVPVERPVTEKARGE
jgi:hypothetical protein